MPELPEVETMRRGVLGAVGCRIAAVQLPPCALKPILIQPDAVEFQRRAKGQRIEDVGRVGKRVLLHLGSGDAIVFEPRMTGLVLIEQPPDPEHLRFELQLRGRGPRRLRFWDRRGLGNVRLLDRDEQQEQLGGDRLGPDALRVTADLLKERLGKSRRAVKVALLDQRAVAGIGNLYAAEILHLATVHPELACSRVSRRQWERIATATVEILTEAIRCEGSTLSDGTYRNALNNPGGYQNHHRVYDRAGETCGQCEQGVVQRIVQAQRATFFCPHCQTRRLRR